jgi:hypothetical protein
VLELAAEQKLLDLQIALDALQRTSFRMSNAIVSAAIQRDAAWKRAEQSRRTP